jgi:outer membrane protein assembly factor BamB
MTDMRCIPKGRRGRMLLVGAMLAVAALVAGVVVLRRPRPSASDKQALDVPPLKLPSIHPAPETGPLADWPAFHGGGTTLGVAESIGPPPMKVRWTYRAPHAGPIEAGAAIVGDSAYVGDTRGTLSAIDLATGKARWTCRIAAAFATTPLVLDGRVLLGDLEGTFHAYAAADGKELWTYNTDDAINGSANAWGDTILFGNDNGGIYALNARTGKELWTAQADDRINSAPAIRGGAVPTAIFAGCDFYVRVLTIKDGTELFNVNMEAVCPGSPAVLSDRIIVGTDRGRVVCLSADGQRELWVYSGVGQEELVVASPAVDQGLVVIGAQDQTVHAIDLATGKGVWTFVTRDDVDSSPVISDGRVYVGSKDRELYVLDLKTGRKLWEFPAGHPITATPAIGQGVLVIGDESGTVYCLEPEKRN